MEYIHKGGSFSVAIRVITDSSADLPQEMVERYGIKVVPLSIEFQGEVYQDGVLSGKEFYDMMEQAENLPRTSSPSPQAFADVFKEIPKEDQIICLTLSAKLSGTHQAAVLGAELAERKVWFIDSQAATLALGLLAVSAAEMAKVTNNIQEIIGEINQRIDNLRILVFLDTAKNIVKSGRLSKMAGSLVDLFNIKLLLTNRVGELEFLTKIRGKKLAIHKMLEMLEEHKQSLQDKIIAISHADNLPDAEALKEIIVERFKPKEVILNYMGSCIGTHAGRGGLTISFVK